jgi:hypothetical protein
MSQELSFRTLLYRAVRSCGLNPATLDVELAECFATWLQMRVEEAWLHTIWPQTCRIECRAIAFPGMEVEPVTFDRTEITWDSTVVTWDQAATQATVPYAIDFDGGDHTIAELLNVWRDDPRLCNAPRALEFWVTAERAYLSTDAPEQVFIRFRRERPQFTSVPYDASAVYAAGDLFLYSDGECYRVEAGTAPGETPVSDPGKFAVQRVPEVLAAFAAMAARADYLMDDGQDDKGNAQLNRAQKFLNDRMGDLTVLQQQHATYSAA